MITKLMKWKENSSTMKNKEPNSKINLNLFTALGPAS